MDLYKRRRTDWVKESRNSAGTEGFHSFPESNGGVKKEGGKHLTAIELARQKHAANKLKKEREAKTSQQEAYEASKGKGKAAVTA
jgi:nucleolar protein 9